MNTQALTSSLPRTDTTQKLKKKWFMYKIFPISSLAQRMISVPRFVYHLLFVYTLLQNLLASHWIVRLGDHGHSVGDMEVLLSEILFLDTMVTALSTDVYYAVVLAVHAIIAGSAIAVMYLYVSKRTTHYWLLVFYYVVSRILLPAFYLPLCCQMGHLVNDLREEFGSFECFAVILGAILLVYNTYQLYLITMMSSSSVYFMNSLYCYGSGMFYFVGIWAMPLITFLAIVFKSVGSVQYILCPLHLIGAVGMAVWVFWLPMYDPRGCAVRFGMYVAIAATDMYTFVMARMMDDLNVYVAFLPPLALFVFFVVVGHFSIQARMLWLTRSTDKSNAVLKLRSALMLNQKQFRWASYIESCLDMMETVSDRLTAAKFLIVFPQYRSYAIALVAYARKNVDLSTFDEYLLRELSDIIVGQRPLAVVDEIELLRAQAAAASLFVRSMWANLPVSQNLFDQFTRLDRRIADVESTWFEIRTKYPTNALAAFDYANILIECESDYAHAAFYQAKAQLLKKGDQFEYDGLVTHFLKVYPKFYVKLLKHVRLADMGDLELSKRNSILQSMVPDSRLRLEFQRSLEACSPTSLRVAEILSVLRLLAVICLLVLLSVGGSDFFTQRLEGMELMKSSHNVSCSCSLMLLVISYGNAYYKDSYARPENLPPLYPSDRVVHATPIFEPSYGLSDILAEFGGEALTGINDLRVGLFHKIEEDGLTSRISTAVYGEEKVARYFHSTSEFYDVPTCDRSNAQYFSCKAINAKFENRHDASSQYLALDQIMNSVSAANHFLDMVNASLQDELEAIDDFKRNSNIILFAFGACWIVVMIIGYYACFVIFKRKFDRISHMLQRFPQPVCDRAAVQICRETCLRSDTLSADINGMSQTTMIALVIAFDVLFSLATSGTIVYAFILRNGQADDLNGILTYAAYSYMRTAALTLAGAQVVGLNANYLLQLYKTGLQKTLIELRLFTEECDLGIVHQKPFYMRQLDEFLVNDSCPSDWGDYKTQHERLTCLDMTSAVQSMIESSSQVLRMNDGQRRFNDTNVLTLVHQIYGHILQRMAKKNEWFERVANYGLDNYNLNYLRCILGFVIIEVVHCAVSFGLSVTLRRIFKRVVQFLLHMNPSDLLVNGDLVNVLYPYYGQITKSSPSYRLLMENTNPIAFIAANGDLISLNQAFLGRFGWDNARIMGRPVSTIVANGMLIDYINRLHRTPQDSSAVFDSTCIAENGDKFPARITVIPIGNRSSNSVTCALYFEDFTRQSKDKKAVEILKQETDLMMKRLDFSITDRFSGYSVEKCTLCHVRLYGSGIASLSRVANEVDELLREYHSLERVLLANGVYCVVGGGNISDHVWECVQFVSRARRIVCQAGFGDIGATVDTGTQVTVRYTSGENRRPVVHSEMSRSVELLSDLRECGKMLVTEAVYIQLLGASRNLPFSQKSKILDLEYYDLDISLCQV